VGEPFLREDVFDLIEYLHHKGITSIGFETNGTLIDSQLVESLNEHSPPVETIQVSLDGGSANVNDTIRGRGAFEKAVHGLNQVISDTNLRTTISFTIHSQNIDDIPRIIELGEQMGVNTLYLTRLVPIGRGKQMDADMITPQQTRDVLTYLHKKNKEFEKLRDRIKKPIIAENRSLFHLVDEDEAIQRFAAGKKRLGNACAVGVATFTILSDGAGVPCRRLPIPLGNLLTQSFLDIWFKSDVLWDFRRRQRLLKGKCRKCRFLQYRGLCDGGAACIAYGCYGDYNNPDPQCWYNSEEP
jgi:radical SAM protein with 4Fe4S-binding SPASM domain